MSDASMTFSDLWCGPIYAVLRHLKLESSRGAELHSLACGLGGGLYAVLRNLKFSTLLTYFLNNRTNINILWI